MGLLGRKNKEEYDERFELEGESMPIGTIGSKTEKGAKASNNNSKDGQKGKRGKNGSKIGTAVVSLLIVGGLSVGALATGGYLGHGPFKGLANLTESGRARSLVAEYTNDEAFCSLPDTMLINKAYDISYTSGEKLVANLKKNDVKYCEVFDEFYTPSGEKIAILTYDVATLDVLPAIKVGIGFSGAEVYMPVEGYTLSGNMCYKEGSEQLIKVVPVSANGDYSSITLDSQLTETATITGASLVNVREVSTKTYDEILDMTLICDVADGAVLDENNQCLAAFNLVPKSYKFTK